MLRVWWRGVQETERSRAALWLPVAMGTGVAVYFALRTEPPALLGPCLLFVFTLGAILFRGWVLRFGLILCAAIALGFAAGQIATARAPPLETLPARAVVLTGMVGAVELLPGDVQRITITTPRLRPGDPALRRDVRIRLRPDEPVRLQAGDRISVRALLRPSWPALYPGAWDMQRDFFFNGIAGTGRALNPVTMVDNGANPPTGLLGPIQQLREAIARRFVAGMQGESGPIGSALFTGYTAAIPRTDQAAFRDSGLAHLLSVSGLHVAIVIGLVFSLVRGLLALSQFATLRWPCKQIAALAGLGAAFFYTPLAGSQVPLLRSVAMATLVVLGMLAGRLAFTLRGLALAAAGIILIAPQELLGVSAQMSFSAVLALIAGHEALRPPVSRWSAHARFPLRVALYVLALATTSLLAGSASAPFGIYHFGRVQMYFIVANILAVPLCGVWVMPWGLVALVLMPFGLEAIALRPMSWGIQAILWIAHATAALPAAVLSMPRMPSWGLVVYTFGLTWLCIWRSAWRRAGIALILLGLASPLLYRPADILVSSDTRLVAARLPAQVVLQEVGNVPRVLREGLAGYWAIDDIATLPVERAGHVTCDASACRLHWRADLGDVLIVPRGGAVGAPACAGIVLIIATGPLRDACPDVPVIDRATTWRSGAFAIWLDPTGPRLLSDLQFRGQRPWVDIPPGRRPDLPPALIE